MKTVFASAFIFFLPFYSNGQDTLRQNTSDQILLSDRSLSLRGYAQIDFNQPYSSDTKYNGKAEVHRMVLFTGYKYNDQLSFISEIEIEHGNEIFLEQAFVNYKFHPAAQLRAGLILIPMGIINEYHEPTLYNGVERPNVDKVIVPTTWRELGLGLTGLIGNTGLRYQAYIVNGFKSYDERPLLNGSNGLRGGRQKGIKSTLSSPNISFKMDYFGVRNLKLGLSYYGGKTQSTLYDGLDKNDPMASVKADSSAIGLNMIGLDGRYDWKAFEMRGQYIVSFLSNTSQYNAFGQTDLGSRMEGLLIEVAYNVLSKKSQKNQALLPFVRYEQYNTQANTENFEASVSNDRQELIAGLTWRHARFVSFKLDHQWQFTGTDNESFKTFNAGIGVWF